MVVLKYMVAVGGGGGSSRVGCGGVCGFGGGVR